MQPQENFYTLKGYALAEENKITTAMEDYLEMICRLEKQKPGSVRIQSLADLLHVKPSSASKMVANLREKGLVEAQKYGQITLTETGRIFGQYLLYRHDLLHQFLCFINHSADELEQVEKIEHFMDEKTVHNIQSFLDGLTK